MKTFTKLNMDLTIFDLIFEQHKSAQEVKKKQPKRIGKLLREKRLHLIL